VVVVDVLQAGLSRILGVMSDRQSGRGPDHTHGHVHASRPGVTGRLRHVLRPHSHGAAGQVDAAMETSAEGTRALWISLAVLGGTAALQAAVVAVSGSVALLGDTLHNAADALTAVPLGIAFVVGRRPSNCRYTYGYGRAEDLAGVVIVVFIAASSAVAAYEAVTRLAHPRPVTNLIAVAVAALIGFTGNEVVARYRIVVGRKIGSAALAADGLHARTDGFTSLTVSMAWARCLAWGLAPARSSARHSASSAERLAITASSQWPLHSCPYWCCMPAQSWPIIMPGPIPGPGW
jgi:Co/Zn/Cd efflux system component